MTEPSSAMSAWANFYVVVGSSGGALIGLQFVVMTLIAGSRHRSATGALSAFGTPTVVHLTAALLVSAIMSAPWSSLAPLSMALAGCGLGGLLYGLITFRRARRQTDYEPVWDDWLWHTLLPCGCYAVLTAAAACLRANPGPAMFGIGAAALALLLIGIHNAWDTVTHIVGSGPDD